MMRLVALCSNGQANQAKVKRNYTCLNRLDCGDCLHSTSTAQQVADHALGAVHAQAVVGHHSTDGAVLCWWEGKG